MSEEASVSMSSVERFWAKVEKTETCWLWTAAVNRVGGYGHFRVGLRTVYAHRLSYEWANGPIPDGLTIDHLCRVTTCVRPSHLEVVTNRENILRSEGFAACHARKNNCPRGHPYNETNTHVRNGERHCRTCERIRARQRWAAVKASRVAGGMP